MNAKTAESLLFRSTFSELLLYKLTLTLKSVQVDLCIIIFLKMVAIIFSEVQNKSLKFSDRYFTF